MNSSLGIFLHAIGGLAAGSFYMLFKKVRNWAWETYWLVNGFFTWIIMPWLIAILFVPSLPKVLVELNFSNTMWPFIYGICWGIGNLTFGLTLRYLGLSLGMAMVLGLATIFGTLLPPLTEGKFGALTNLRSGQFILVGILICLTGIIACGLAGLFKEKEMPAAEKQKYIRDFNFKKGIAAAFFSGIMSACFAFGMQAGKPVAAITAGYGTPEIWKNSVLLIILMSGGFICNATCCVYLNIKNKSVTDYRKGGSFLLVNNYFFSALAGIVGFMEFMFYGMGTSKMGKNDFISFSIHLAFVIMFSTMWGIISREWKGSGRKTVWLLVTGLLLLLLSTVLMGLGNELAGHE